MIFNKEQIEEIRQREIKRRNDERHQEALKQYHAMINYNIKHNIDKVVTIPKYKVEK